MQIDAGKPEAIKQDPETLLRLLDLELAQKRVERARAGAQRRNVRAMCFLFLGVLLIGALIAFLFLFSRVNEEHSNPQRPKVSFDAGR